jgi:hypothetical protein
VNKWHSFNEKIIKWFIEKLKAPHNLHEFFLEVALKQLMLAPGPQSVGSLCCRGRVDSAMQGFATLALLEVPRACLDLAPSSSLAPKL